MAQCSKSNCKKQTVGKETLCPDHLRLKKAEDLKQAQQKQQMEKKLAEEKDARTAMGLLQKKNEETAAAKKLKIAAIALLWNAEVKKVVTQVLKLRTDNPGRTGINAGKNAGLATTLGGTDNPVAFKMPDNDFKITPAEVYAKMTGFEGSDSGSFKFRVSEVFVHAH